MTFNLSSLTGLINQIVGLLRTLATLGLAIIGCLLIAQLLGIRVPYFDPISGDLTGKAAMVAALAFFLRG